MKDQTFIPIPSPHADYHMMSGCPVYAMDPGRTVILASDIYAHARGAARYNGAPPVSVLAHSALVAMLAERAGESACVVSYCAGHDLAEAYTGEIVSALKPILSFKAFEVPWERRVRRAVGHSPDDFDADLKHRIKVYDLRALRVELEYYRHPVLQISKLPPATSSERRAGWLTLPRIPGMDWLNWRRLCQWIPRLTVQGPL